MAGTSGLWTPDGTLPPGDHPMTPSQLRSSAFVTGGETPSPGWDRQHRQLLVANLGYLASHLRTVGIDDLYIGGSFCTTKGRPGDIDGYFVTDFPVWRAQLQRLKGCDSSWTYDLADRKPNTEGKLKWPQWFKFKVELFTVFRPPFDALSFMGSTKPPVPIDEFLRRDTSLNPIGMIRILPESAAP